MSFQSFHENRRMKQIFTQSFERRKTRSKRVPFIILRQFRHIFACNQIFVLDFRSK
jgi:hypothetical protein